MTTDFRALCEELLDEVAARPLLLDRDLVARARVALARPEPEGVGPTDEELLHEWDLVPGARAYEEDVVDFARAVLARWGNYPAKPDSSIDGPAVPESREPVAVVGQSVIAEGEVEK